MSDNQPTNSSSSNSSTNAALDDLPPEQIAQRNSEIERYLPLIRKVVGRLMMRFPPIVEEQDMMAVGVLGLIDALDRYQPGALSFSQYAEIRIRGAVLDELRRNDLFSRGMRRKAKRYQEVKKQLEHRIGGTPTTVEIAQAMQVSVDEVEQMRQQVQPMHFLEVESIEISSDQHPAKGGAADASPYDQTRRNELRDKVRDALDSLPERERMILRLYYFEELTMRKIGDLLGLSESRICQIHRKACNSLKSSLGFDHTELSDIL